MTWWQTKGRLELARYSSRLRRATGRRPSRNAAIRWSLRRMIAASMGLTPGPRAPGTRGSPAAGRDGACRYRSTGETPGTGIHGTLRVLARRADGLRAPRPSPGEDRRGEGRSGPDDRFR